MKNYHRLKSYGLFMLLAVLPLFMLSGCGSGAASIPELSGLMLDALNKKSEKKFEACMPSQKDMEQAYLMYFPDPAKDKEAQKAEALDKATSRRLNLIQDFRKVSADAGEGKWTLASFPFTQKDRKEGFKEASVRMVLNNAAGVQRTLHYTAYEVKGKWYVMDDVKWGPAPLQPAK